MSNSAFAVDYSRGSEFLENGSISDHKKQRGAEDSMSRQGVGSENDLQNFEYLLGVLNLKVSMVVYYSDRARTYLEKGQESEMTEMVTVTNKYVCGIHKIIEKQRDADLELDEGQRALIHDISNMTCAVVGYTGLAMIYCEAKNFEELAKSLEKIYECAAIANYKLSENDILKKLDIDEAQSLHKILQLALRLSEPRKQKAGDVKVFMDIPPDHIKIGAGEADFVRVFMNLFNNAFDALAQSESVVKRAITEKVLSVRARTSEGMIEIEIADSGIGMTSEICEKIFEAYFTTKGKSGTGIGLHFCKEVIEKNNGKIWVVSERGVGTIFYVRIPLLKMK